MSYYNNMICKYYNNYLKQNKNKFDDIKPYLMA